MKKKKNIDVKHTFQIFPFFLTISYLSLGFDYHWYRLDQGGLWSHKPGQTRVTKSDNAGNDIADPRTADTGTYVFQAFMTSDIALVKIN